MKILSIVLFCTILYIMMRITYSLIIKVRLLHNKTTFGTLSYLEVQEEFFTLWFLLLISLFGIYIEFIYLFYLAMIYVVYNLAVHVVDLVNYLNKHSEVTVHAFYTKKEVEKEIQLLTINNSHIKPIYRKNQSLKKLVLKDETLDDVKKLVDELSSNPKISDKETINWRKELILNWFLIATLFSGLIFVTIFLVGNL